MPDRQSRGGLLHDLREAFPDMRELSPRNLRYMRAFAAAWPDRRFVQEVLAQIKYALRGFDKPMGVAEWEPAWSNRCRKS